MLVGGIVIQGKKYGTKDFLAAAVMCIGLIWFTLIDVTISLNFHPAGIFTVLNFYFQVKLIILML